MAAHDDIDLRDPATIQAEKLEIALKKIELLEKKIAIIWEFLGEAIDTFAEKGQTSNG